MTGRSPARLLAPLALAAAAVALFAVVLSGGGERVGSSSAGDDSDRPVATATPAKKLKRKPRASSRTYTVKPGDTPSGIAESENVDLDALLEANPEADPSALAPGQELTLP